MTNLNVYVTFMQMKKVLVKLNNINGRNSEKVMAIFGSAHHKPQVVVSDWTKTDDLHMFKVLPEELHISIQIYIYIYTYVCGGDIN